MAKKAKKGKRSKGRGGSLLDALMALGVILDGADGSDGDDSDGGAPCGCEALFDQARLDAMADVDMEREAMLDAMAEDGDASQVDHLIEAYAAGRLAGAMEASFRVMGMAGLHNHAAGTQMLALGLYAEIVEEALDGQGA